MVNYIKPSYEILAVTQPKRCITEGNPPVTSVYLRPVDLIERAGRTCYKSEDRIGNTVCPDCGNQVVPTKKTYEMDIGYCDKCDDKKKLIPSSEWFVKMIVEHGHLSVIEHVSVTVKFISNRGFTHELVRHRLCSYSQESTRYCDYGKEKHGKEISVIDQRMIILHEMLNGSDFHFPLDETVEHFLEWLKGRGEEFDENLKMWKNDKLNAAFHAVGDWIDAMIRAEGEYLKMREHDAPPQVARGVLPIDLKTEIVMTANLRQWGHVFKMRASPKAHPNMQQLMYPLLEDFKKMFPGVYDNLEVF
jgi:thymidylate synthase (FAD)